MKMTNQEEITNLLQKFYSNVLSPEERFRLSEILNNEEESVIDPVLNKIWDNYSSTDNENVQAAFVQLKKKLAESSRIPDKKSNLNLRMEINVILKYVAIILITAGATWLLTKKTTPVKLQMQDVYTEINVPKGSKSALTFSDGTRVWLNSGSKLRYPSSFSGKSRMIYVEGEAFFDVKHQDKVPFIVKTSEILIKVFGTRFNVKAFPEDKIIETTLVNGLLSVETIGAEGKAGQILDIKPNQIASFSKETGKLEVLSTDKMTAITKNNVVTNPLKAVESRKIESIETITAWKENRLVFRRESIDNLIIKLERWYGMKIINQNSELKKYSFTGTFENETVEQALNALKLAYPFHFSITKNIIVIKP